MPTLSLDAFHASAAAVCVLAVTFRPVGLVGGRESRLVSALTTPVVSTALTRFRGFFGFFLASAFAADGDPDGLAAAGSVLAAVSATTSSAIRTRWGAAPHIGLRIGPDGEGGITPARDLTRPEQAAKGN